MPLVQGALLGVRAIVRRSVLVMRRHLRQERIASSSAPVATPPDLEGRDMRRIGNRLQLALARWKRESRKLELFRFRQRMAKKFGEYECVGGPLDGTMRTCRATGRYILASGYYEIKQRDCRLHFHQGVVSPFARDWSET
jgi:hypothetical protein